MKPILGKPQELAQEAGDPEYWLITRSSHGQMAFLANMLSKMKQGTKLGSRLSGSHRPC